MLDFASLWGVACFTSEAPVSTYSASLHAVAPAVDIRPGETIGMTARMSGGAGLPWPSPDRTQALMNPISIALLALAMSTDAFAAAIGKGSTLQNPHWREALRTGLIFGVIEAITPVIGWAVGSLAADYVSAWDHWLAFCLLAILGLRMIWAGLKADGGGSGKTLQHSFWLLALTGFATSIDAMTVGVGLAFLNIDIYPIAAAIGFTTFVMATIGVMIGKVLGAIAGKRAEIVGGLLLIGIGCVILQEHGVFA